MLACAVGKMRSTASTLREAQKNAEKLAREDSQKALLPDGPATRVTNDARGAIAGMQTQLECEQLIKKESKSLQAAVNRPPRQVCSACPTPQGVEGLWGCRTVGGVGLWVGGGGAVGLWGLGGCGDVRVCGCRAVGLWGCEGVGLWRCEGVGL